MCGRLRPDVGRRLMFEGCAINPRNLALALC